MTKEHKIALIQLQSMLKTGELHGGTITQRAQFVVALTNALLEPLFTAEDMLEYGNDRVCRTMGSNLLWQKEENEKELERIKFRRTETICGSCGGKLLLGVALFNPAAGRADFDSRTLVNGTMSPSDTVKTVSCMKCESCGHSFTL